MDYTRVDFVIKGVSKDDKERKKRVMKITYPGYQNRLDKPRGYDSLMDFLGDNNIVTADEIVPDMIVDNEHNAYILDYHKLAELRDKCFTKLESIGVLEDFINKNDMKHMNYYNWFTHNDDNE